MNIALTSRHEQLIEKLVAGGAYGSAAEVVRDALRMLEEREERKQRLARMEAEVAKGFQGPMTSWTKDDPKQLKKLIASRTRGKRRSKAA